MNYTCPRTDFPVLSRFMADPRTLERMEIPDHGRKCPMCDERHTIGKRTGEPEPTVRYRHGGNSKSII